MRKVLIGLVVLLALTDTPLEADSGCAAGGAYTAVAFASEKITVSSTAIGFTLATFAPSGSPAATEAYCSNETNSIRFLTTGAAPAADTGVLVAAGSYIRVCQEDIRRFKAIRVSADGTLNCQYLRPPQ